MEEEEEVEAEVKGWMSALLQPSLLLPASASFDWGCALSPSEEEFPA